MEKFTGRPDYGYYTPKTESHKEKNFKKQVIKTSNCQEYAVEQNISGEYIARDGLQ